jgi:hypothetical protein
MTWVIRNGEFMEKELVINPARSNLACPHIIRDGIDPLQHMADGHMYDSKRAFEQATKQAGCVCVGNEPIQNQSSEMPDIGPVAKDISEAYVKVRDGYKPERLEERGVPTTSGFYE